MLMGNLITDYLFFAIIVDFRLIYWDGDYDTYLKTLEKYCDVDIRFRYMLLGYRTINLEHVFRNVTYLELMKES